MLKSIRFPRAHLKQPEKRRRSEVRAWRVYDRSETVVQSLGIILAVASTSFASYMISNSEREPQFPGLEHLAIFSRPAMAPRRFESAGGRIAKSEPYEVDYTPVGSTPSSRQNQLAPGFNLLGVSSGRAIIQGNEKIIRVSQGDMIDGLGRIIAIERRREGWVVVTRGGLIVSN
jgi:hypothetical protein